MARDPAKNRANVARHAKRERDRRTAIIRELLEHCKMEVLPDGQGGLSGYRMTFELPQDTTDRVEQLAQEHGRTAQQLMEEAMVVYGQRLLAEQRRRDARN